MGLGLLVDLSADLAANGLLEAETFFLPAVFFVAAFLAAVRLTLKDLYIKTNQPEKTLELMRATFIENDDAPIWFRPGKKIGGLPVENKEERKKREKMSREGLFGN